MKSFGDLDMMIQMKNPASFPSLDKVEKMLDSLRLRKEV
jgi:hypothetical protein